MRGRRICGVWLAMGLAALSWSAPPAAEAAVSTATEPNACLSTNPADWPPPSKPYFLIVADTAGSMTTCTNPTTAYPESCPPGAPLNSCGLVPTRYNDLKCAIEKLTKAFAGQVALGLATFATTLENCPAGCSAQCDPASCPSETYGCTASCFLAELNTNGTCLGCGPAPAGPESRAGAFVRVTVPQDRFWSAPPEPSNVQDLFDWVDASCAGDRELFAAGARPLNGALRDVKRYFEFGWTHPDDAATFFPTPLDESDLAGSGVNGGSACRSVNTILVAGGDETCDTAADASGAAADLFDNGVSVGGKSFKVRTHVVNFAGATQIEMDAIAAAGGTGAAQFASNEAQLTPALFQMVASSLGAEVCDNLDNDCNGCTDEGYPHFANVGQTCCQWPTPSEREACLSSYRTSVTSSPPLGDTTLLPCTSPLQQTDPASWLCFDPGDVCDGVDNNFFAGVDDGQLRCGDPLHCPTFETCNGKDDDCDGQIDQGGVCGACVSTPEICDGCDNDCDGIVDNGTFAPISCGTSSPASCQGTQSCVPPQLALGGPGTCIPSAGWGSCNNSPTAETCDGVDNDCDGVVDDGIPSDSCEVPGTSGLAYDASSQCRLGALLCGIGCVGFVGPTPEVSDGIDNDCNGAVDDFTLGTAVVAKRTWPEGASDLFTFTGGLAGSVADGGEIVGGALAPGSYAATEQPAGGWVLKSIDCDDTDSTIDLGSSSATFQIAAGETTRCTFTNCKPELTLPAQTISIERTITVCNRIVVGAGIEVAASGDLTLRAGRSVEIGNGFSVAAGASLTVVIDPSLEFP